MLRRLLVLVVVVALAGAAIDLVVRHVAQDQAATEVRAALLTGTGGVVTSAGSVDVGFGSLPFAPRLLLWGSVPETSVDVRALTARGVTFDRLHVVVHDLTVDRGALVGERRVVVSDVGRVDARLQVGAAELSRVAGAPVVLGADGRVVVGTGPGALSAEVAVDGGALEVRTAVARLRIELPGPDLLPCTPGVEVADDELVLTCSADVLPPVVRTALGMA